MNEYNFAERKLNETKDSSFPIKRETIHAIDFSEESYSLILKYLEKTSVLCVCVTKNKITQKRRM